MLSSSTKTLSGTYTAGYSLSSSYTGVRITSAAMVLGAAGTPGYGLGGNAGNAGDGLVVTNYSVVRNAGLIEGGAGGAGTDGSFTVDGGNGGDGGVGARLTGIVINTGTIEGGAGGQGGSSSSGSFAYGYETGVYGGGGGAGGAGVYLSAGTLTNHGVILGGTGGAGGSCPNGSRGGGPNGVGVLVNSHASLVNLGLIEGGSGVTLTNASLSNGSSTNRTATINGGVVAYASSITNNGTITGRVIVHDSQVTNLGTIAGGDIAVWGFGATEVYNSKLIAGGYNAGVALEDGGLVVNNADGTIEGNFFGVYCLSFSAAMTVVNFGMISCTRFNSVQLRTADSRLIVEGGSKLVGDVIGGFGTLEMGAGAGAGSISGIGSKYQLFSAFQVDGGGLWSVSGVNTMNGDLTVQSSARLRLGGTWDPFGGTSPTAGIGVLGALTNDGVITVAGAELSVTGAVSGRGTVMINDGLAFFQSNVSQSVHFGSGGGELMLSSAEDLTGHISGFSSSGLTTLDLLDIGFVSASEATFSGNTKGGVLTVSDGTTTAQFRLLGNFTGATWVTADDGAGGVTVVAGPSTMTRVPGFISAMASFASANHAVSATSMDPAKPPPQLVLVSPGR